MSVIGSRSTESTSTKGVIWPSPVINLAVWRDHTDYNPGIIRALKEDQYSSPSCVLSSRSNRCWQLCRGCSAPDAMAKKLL